MTKIIKCNGSVIDNYKLTVNVDENFKKGVVSQSFANINPHFSTAVVIILIRHMKCYVGAEVPME